jgi:hypothetical protein
VTLTHKGRAAIQRRDPTGHLNPKYAAELRSKSLERGARDGESVAFLGSPRSAVTLAETLGEEFVSAATSGEDARLDDLDARQPEDEGGPFVVTSGRAEFAKGRDASNPKGATREPFPTAASDDSGDGPDEDDGG